MIKPSQKWNRHIGHVHLPKATIGRCRNHVRCKQRNVQLANGYCVKCWDKGFDTAEVRMEESKQRKLRKKQKHIPE